MDHPNIAKVLDAGTTETGRPYFVMELVKGIPITDYFEQEGTEVTEKLKLFIRVCQAIQHAHQKGIIHRDIKPSNVMVTLHDGEPVPKVIDFGIAKATQGDLTDKTIYTQYNQFIGTPAYMSPEQAEMSGLDIDTRSDVYSLGVLLYEILTGSTPFDSKELMASGIDEMRKIIRERDPVKPSTRLSQTVDLSNGEFDRKPPEVRLPVDLDWIALKCLEKDRSRRYDTANGLCLDIQRHLNNELVEARPPSVAYRISVGWRRNRVIGSAAILSLAAILIGLSIAVGMYFRERAARTTADNLREKEGQARATAQAAAREAKLSEQRAVESGQKERLQRYVSDMRLAQAALNSENLGLARGLLDKHRPSQTGQDLRGWEWRWLWKQIRSDSLYSLYQGEERIQSLSVSPNGRWVGFFEDDRRPQFWDLRRRKEMTLPLGDAEVQAATFSSADSNLVLLTRKSELQFVQSWDLESLRLVSERRVPLEINDFRLSKDGRRLIGRRDWGGSMHVVDLASDSPFTTYDIVRSRGDNAGVFWAISPAGDRVAQASDSWVVLHSLETGEELWRREATTDRFVTAVEFSPNGENLVTGHGYVEGAIRLWNAGTGDLIDTLEGHRFWVSDLEFTDGGETLISCSGDQSLRVWDLNTLEERDVLQGHPSEVHWVSASTSAGLIFSGDKRGGVYAWDLPEGERYASDTKRPESIVVYRFLNDEKLVTLDQSGNLHERFIETMNSTGKSASLGPISRAVFSPGGDRLAKQSEDGIQVWAIDENALPVPIFSSEVDQHFSCFLDSGSTIVTAERLGVGRCRLIEWDLKTGQERRAWPVQWPFVRVQNSIPSLSGDSLFGPSSKGLRFIERATGGETVVLGANADLRGRLADIWYWALSTDGRHIALGSNYGFGLFLTRESASWKGRITTQKIDGFFLGIHGVDFSPAGRYLALGSNGEEAVNLWRTDAQELVLKLPGEGSVFDQILFSPNGSTITALNSVGQCTGGRRHPGRKSRQWSERSEFRSGDGWLDGALCRFAAESPEKAKLVELRFFAGLKLKEAADALGISPATAKRHWAYARAWLLCELKTGSVRKQD